MPAIALFLALILSNSFTPAFSLSETGASDSEIVWESFSEMMSGNALDRFDAFEQEQIRVLAASTKPPVTPEEFARMLRDNSGSAGARAYLKMIVNMERQFGNKDVPIAPISSPEK